MDFSDVAVVLVAAGRGVRAGGDGPKQYRLLAGQPVLARTIAAFATALPAARLLCVIHPDDRDLYDAAAASSGAADRLLAPVIGGASRQDSVRAGLDALRWQPSRGSFSSTTPRGPSRARASSTLRSMRRAATARRFPRSRLSMH